MIQHGENRFHGPTDVVGQMMNIQGVPLMVLADVPDGAAVHWTSGPDPLLGEVVAGPRLPPGAMVLVIPPQVAAAIRPQLRLAEAQQVRQALLGSDGAPLRQ